MLGVVIAGVTEHLSMDGIGGFRSSTYHTPTLYMINAAFGMGT